MLVVMAPLMLLIRRRIARRSRRVDTEDDVILLADLMAIGVAAGLNVSASLELASQHVGGEVAIDVATALHRASRLGTATGLISMEGAASEVFRTIAVTSVAGAPLGSGLGALASRLRRDRHASAVEDARRLPVRLLVPLTLLVLPGFVVIAVGPAVVDAISRLGPIP